MTSIVDVALAARKVVTTVPRDNEASRAVLADADKLGLGHDIHQLALTCLIPQIQQDAELAWVDGTTHDGFYNDELVYDVCDNLRKLEGPDPVWIVLSQDRTGNSMLFGFADEEDARELAKNLGTQICMQLPVAPRGTKIVVERKPTIIVPQPGSIVLPS